MEISALLKSLNAEKIYYKANPGNGGDALIAYATYKYFLDNNIELKFITKEEPVRNKVIVYSGGGNLIPDYNDCANFLRETHEDARAVVILPHSIYGHVDLLSELKENVYIYCREKRSYLYVKKTAKRANVFIAHDMAFQLTSDDFIDVESTSNPLRMFVKQIIKAFVHLEWSTIRRTLNAYRCDVERTSIALPKDNIDVSSQINYAPLMDNPDLVKQTVVDIIKFISYYRVVNTNRLHIAIAASLIGKKVKFYSNSYYKNRAVFNHSMRHLRNIEFVDD